MKKDRHIGFISGAKGLACFLVMAGHFFGVFIRMDDPSFDLSTFMTFYTSPLGSLVDASFWLRLFFVASGYLLALSKIDDLKDLCLKIVKRFLRLGAPILFCCIVIYVFILCFGLHCQETVALFENQWFQSAYHSEPLTLVGALRSPFDVLLLGKCTFNAPYWVLRSMFFDSIMVYLCLYLQAKASKVKWLRSLIGYAFLLASYRISAIAFGLVLGMTVRQHEDIIKKVLGSRCWLAVLALVSVVVLYYVREVPRHIELIFATMIATTPYIPVLSRFLSSRPLKFLGSISFGIYSFHWPVFCCIGAWILLIATPGLGIWWAFLVTFVSSVVITLVMSYLFSQTAEKFASKLTDRIVGAIAVLLEKLHPHKKTDMV